MPKPVSILVQLAAVSISKQSI